MAINVLHVYKAYSLHSKGGVEEVIRQLCIATSNLGINNQMVFISNNCNRKQIIEMPEATIYCYPMSFEIASCGFSWSLWKDFKQLSAWADIIHYQFPWPFSDILAITRQQRNKPYVISYQSDIVRQQGLNKLYRPLMKLFLKQAEKIVATSPAYINSSLVLKEFKKKVIMIPNGISDDLLTEDFQSEIDNYFNLYGNNFFLFIGVFRYYKGLDYLLEAAKHSTTPILLVGCGPEMNALKKYAEEQGLSHVHFLGKVSDNQKYALLALSRALVLPSSQRSEAFGMVLLEAARQGKAMISTELGSGTSYINIEKETGFVVPAQNANKLAEAMKIFVENEDEVYVMCSNARKRFLDYFTAELMAKRYVELYKSILTKK